jgi:D-alanyl-D-alanine dipeptidase
MPFTDGFIYKLHKRLIHFVAAIIFLWPVTDSFAQHQTGNKYGLTVIGSTGIFQKMIKRHDSLAMLDLKQFIPGIVVDLRYADTTNFMKQRLYPAKTKTTYLRKKAAVSLAAVQQELNQKKLGLKIWDAYRPYSVTEKMWEPIKDDRYAADPKFGSGHNRGAAVDLTIIELETLKELNMGTGFDHFSDTAHMNFTNLPPDVLANRQLLRSVMELHGFKVLDTEWWHFYLPDAKKYDLLDLSFQQLKKITRVR